MAKNFKEMTYKEFKDYSNQRACDGTWNVFDAMYCASTISKIEGIKIKGLFKKKQNEKLREEIWIKFVRGYM